MQRLRLITAPAAKPILVTDVAAQVRNDLTAESTLVELYIAAVTAKAESYLRRALITQTWELTMESFPEAIRLPLPPVQSVTSITYLDADGVRQTLDASAYSLTAGEPATILPTYGTAWPSCRVTEDSVAVRYVAGYGATGTGVPEEVRAWLLLNAATLYENRETVGAANVGENLKTMADSLIDGLVVWQ